MTHKNIHEAIAATYREVGYVQKTRSQALNYSFAGEAALIEALRPTMVENGIYMSVVGISDVQHETYQTSRGATMNRVTLVATVRFTHAPSDTSIDVLSVGEGADSGDKASPKAATGAFKYALRQTFCIETGNDPDDSSSRDQERAPQQSSPAAQRVQQAVTELPSQYDMEKPGCWKDLLTQLPKSGLQRPDVINLIGGEWNETAVNEWFGATKTSVAAVFAAAREGKN